MTNELSAWGLALWACMPLLASAQAAKPELDKAAAPLTYKSAFANFKPYQDAPLADWRAVNAAVAGEPGGASGHAGHNMAGMKGMDMPAAPMPAASSAMQMQTPMKPTPKRMTKPMPESMPMPMHGTHPMKKGQP